MKRGYVMQKLTVISSVLLASLVLASSAAMAMPPRFDDVGINVARLDFRINNGVQRGDLTHREERQLRTELRALLDAIKVAKQDRKVTTVERNKLQRQAAQLNRHINKLANNREVAQRDHERRWDNANRYDNPYQQDARNDNRHYDERGSDLPQPLQPLQPVGNNGVVSLQTLPSHH